MHAHTETTGVYFACSDIIHSFESMPINEKAIWERLLKPEVQEAFRAMFVMFNHKVKSVRAFRLIYPEISLQHAVWFYNDIVG